MARGENLPLVQFLLTRGADASYSLWAAVWRGDDVVCREILKNRPRLDLRAHGETPIFYAARLKRLKTLNLLIEAGADPTIVDNQGRDAIDIARARRLPKNLIDQLADPTNVQRLMPRPPSADGYPEEISVAPAQSGNGYSRRTEPLKDRRPSYTPTAPRAYQARKRLLFRHRSGRRIRHLRARRAVI